MAGTELEIASQYAVLNPEDLGEFSLAEVVEENVGGKLSQFDLDRVKIPSGGGKQWLVPTLDGEESQKSIEGIIVYWKQPRSYWKQSIDEGGGNNPPDCSSPDGIIGHGAFGPGSESNPTGDCETCPMSQFGSKPGKAGQACKEMRVLFLLTPGALLPMAVTLPPTSIKPMKRYMLRLASKGVPYYSVVTKLELTQEKNNDGITYSVVDPTFVAKLDGPQAKQIKEFQFAVKAALDDVVLDVAYETDDEDSVS